MIFYKTRQKTVNPSDNCDSGATRSRITGTAFDCCGVGKFHTALMPAAPPDLSPPCARAGPPPMTSASAPPPNFEAALAELEEIVATMEGGKLALQESLASYKRGAELLQYCQATLKDAQQQVQVLEKGVLKAFLPNDVESDES